MNLLLHTICFTPELVKQRVFKIYNDNKTIDAENFHLDVEISYEKTE